MIRLVVAGVSALAITCLPAFVPASASPDRRAQEPPTDPDAQGVDPAAIEVGGPAVDFGVDGAVAVSGGSAHSVLRAPDGALSVVATDLTSTPPTVSVTRLDASGVPDPAYGVGGTATLERPGFGYQDDLRAAVDASGRVVLASIEERGGRLHLVVVRLGADGALDPSFGGGEVATPMLSQISDVGTVTDVAIAPHGGVVVGAVTTRIDPDTDTQVRLSGIVRFADSGAWEAARIVSLDEGSRDEGLPFDRLAVDPAGRVYHAEGRGSTLTVRRFTPDLVTDPSFGWQGEKALEVPGATGAAAVRPTVVRPADQGVTVAVALGAGGGGVTVDLVVGLLDDGQPDHRWFGDGWVDLSTLDDGVEGRGPLTDLVPVPDGGFVAIGRGVPSSGGSDPSGWAQHLAASSEGGVVGPLLVGAGLAPVAGLVGGERLVVVGDTSTGVELRAFTLVAPEAEGSSAQRTIETETTGAGAAEPDGSTTTTSTTTTTTAPTMAPSTTVPDTTSTTTSGSAAVEGQPAA